MAPHPSAEHVGHRAFPRRRPSAAHSRTSKAGSRRRIRGGPRRRVLSGPLARHGRARSPRAASHSAPRASRSTHSARRPDTCVAVGACARALARRAPAAEVVFRNKRGRAADVLKSRAALTNDHGRSSPTPRRCGSRKTDLASHLELRERFTTQRRPWCRALRLRDRRRALRQLPPLVRPQARPRRRPRPVDRPQVAADLVDGSTRRTRPAAAAGNPVVRQAHPRRGGSARARRVRRPADEDQGRGLACRPPTPLGLDTARRGVQDAPGARQPVDRIEEASSSSSAVAPTLPAAAERFRRDAPPPSARQRRTEEASAPATSRRTEADRACSGVDAPPPPRNLGEGKVVHGPDVAEARVLGHAVGRERAPSTRPAADAGADFSYCLLRVPEQIPNSAASARCGRRAVQILCRSRPARTGAGVKNAGDVVGW